MSFSDRFNRRDLVAAAAAVAALGPAMPSASARIRRRPVILSTDCGADMDDQWCLAHLVASPEFDLRAVLTSHAPNLAKPAAETAAGIAREVLAHVPKHSRPQVLPGSSEPLSSRRSPRPNPAVELLLEQSLGFSPKKRLTVLAIGPATDVASALLLDPTFADRVDLIAMGFSKWPEGGDPWNVKNDIAAWQVVLDSRVPVTVGDETVCKRHLQLDRERARALLYGSGDAGKYVADLLITWLDKNGGIADAVTGKAGSWPVWDEVTTAHLLDYTTSEAYPRPDLADDMRFTTRTLDGRAAPFRWITEIDSAKLWQHLARRLAAKPAK